MRSLSRSLSSLLLAAVLGVSVHAKVYQSFSELNTTAQCDFIVIGSGPGGSTIASRLTEDSTVKVLLIEAGGNNEGVLDLEVPAFSQQIPSTYTWNYTAAPSASINNRSIPYARGFVLGGTSSINGMVYSRGAAEDYDAWAKITGDDEWKWDALWPFIKKNERLIPPAGGRNTSGEFDPALHGYNGTVLVTLPTFGASDFDDRCLETARLQEEFDFNLDMNSGRPIGLSWGQRTVGNGERSSAATSYLSTAVRQRPNLSILINTYVTRVLPVQTGSKELAIRKVEVGNRSTRSILGSLTASKEVILSAGVFGTPQILLNSGIGDAKELRAVGVTPIHSLPDVGKNMVDHIGSFVTYSTEPTAEPPVNQTLALEEWVNNRTGILTDNGGSHLILFSRIPSSLPIWKTYSDPSSGPNTPHVENILISAPGQLTGALVILLNPTSRGSITIRSSDPFEDPIIDLGYLKSAYDVLAIREGVQIAKRFLSGPQWSGYLTDATSPDPDALSDDEWSTYIRDNIGIGAHAVGTAAMAKGGVDGGVVDPHLRVKGVSGLRIVDASVIPKIPAAHTQVPTYLIAERAAALIRSSWK